MKFMTVTYPRDGEIEELRGTQHSVPSDVADKRGYIESIYHENVAAKLAELEREAREKQLLQDRIAVQKEQANKDSRISKVEGRLEQLEEVIATPDVAMLVQASSDAVKAVAAVHQVGEQLRQQAESLELNKEQADALIATVNELQARVNDFNEQVGNRIASYQELLNMAQQNAGEQIREYEARYVEAEERATIALSQINSNAQTVRDAVEIVEQTKEQAVAIARQEVEKQTEAMTDEFLAFISLAMQTLGITEQDLDSAANAADIEPTKMLKLTRTKLAGLANIWRASLKVAADVAEGTT